MAIIIGYPGIGKSTLTRSEAGRKLHLIDLESSCFNRNNYFANSAKDPNGTFKDAGWSDIYAKIAKDLSDQGYNVFVSSHREVMNSVFNIDRRPIMIAPALELKEQWITRLATRYANDQTDKNFRALERAANNYTEDVTNFFMLSEDNMEDNVRPFYCRIIEINYDFASFVEDILAQYNTGKKLK